MAKIIITTSMNAVTFSLNEVSQYENKQKITLSKNDVAFDLNLEGRGIDIIIKGKPKWTVSHDGKMQVETVDAVSCETIEELYSLLVNSLKINPKRVVAASITSGTYAGLITNINEHLQQSTKEYMNTNFLGFVNGLSDEFYAIITEYN